MKCIKQLLTYLLILSLFLSLCPINVFALSLPVTLTTDKTENLQEGDIIKLTATVVSEIGIKKVEFFDGDTKLGERTNQPYDFTYVNIPSGTLVLTAKTTNNVNDITASEPLTLTVADKPLYWVNKWAYDFNSYTDATVYSSTGTKLTLPGTLPPTVTLYAGGTITSAKGIYGKTADDYCMQQDSRSGSSEAARVSMPLNNLDKPIETIIAEADVAFSTTTEKRTLFAYRTPKLRYDPFIFDGSGKIMYIHNGGTQTFKDDKGADMTYQSGKWYHAGIKFDFVNKTIMYYLDGKKLNTVDDIPISTDDFISTSEITLLGTHGSSQTGIIYMDNMSLKQEQSSTVTSVLSSPIASSVLYGSSITFAGYAKDQDDKSISKIEFYSNGSLIAEQSITPYNFKKTDLPYGHHNIIARSINADGISGYSKVIPVTVDGIQISKLYSDNMILQRNKDIKIVGLGLNNETIQITLNGVTKNTTVANGKWDVTFPPQPAQKSTILKFITGSGVETVFNNVAIGEVIVCSGQSNMAYSLDKFSGLPAEADKDYPDIRLFFQPEITNAAPQFDIPNGYWDIATTSNATRFSAIGFLTGKKYYLDTNGEVPVGLIYAALGGSSIVPWTPSTAYNDDPDLSANKTSIGGLFNAMVAPLTNFTIGSVVWYQGEANTQLFFSYEKALTAYIESWRKYWNDQSIKFVIIQLPIYNYLTGYTDARSAVGVRDGQFNVSESLPGVVTVVAIDTGDATGIHPNDKLPVAERAMLALKHFTNPTDTSFVWKSPSYLSNKQEDGKMIISFKDVANVLKTKDGQAPRGFKVAGDDKVYIDANAILVGNTIEIDTSAVVGTPSVRYAWEDCPALDAAKKYTTLNLVSSANLPVAPFRTDRDRYTYKTKSTENVFSNPVNFTPVIRSILPETQAKISDNKVRLTIKAKDYDDYVSKVEVYGDNILLGTATKSIEPDTYVFDWNSPSVGSHSVYAVATDSAGATSLKQDPTLGTVSIQPLKYSISFVIGLDPVYTVLPLEDLSGNPIQNFSLADGVKAEGIINNQSSSPITSFLVLAAYNNNKLVRVKIKGTVNDSVNANTIETISLSFDANELTNASKVRAFLLKDLINIQPLGASQEVIK